MWRFLEYLHIPEYNTYSYVAMSWYLDVLGVKAAVIKKLFGTENDS